MPKRLVLLAAILPLTVTLPAAAYIGPGAGMGVIAAFWGLLLAVMSALGFLVLWPLRSHWRRARQVQVGRHPSEARTTSQRPDGRWR